MRTERLPRMATLKVSRGCKNFVGQAKNVLGERFGSLVVIERVGSNKDRMALWKCICDCGATHVASGINLRRGDVASCGCTQKQRSLEVHTKHNHARKGKVTSTYRSWRDMKQRCNNPNHTRFKDYGGWGIDVCDRWNESFENFLEDMKERPDSLTLERIDNEKGYNPKNCKWATYSEQNRNQRGRYSFDRDN